MIDHDEYIIDNQYDILTRVIFTSRQLNHTGL